MSAGEEFPSPERLAALARKPEGREVIKGFMRQARARIDSAQARIDRDNTWLELCGKAMASTAGEREL